MSAMKPLTQSPATVSVVTGANGVIGSAVTSELLRRGSFVVAADVQAFSGPRLEEVSESDRFDYVSLDVTDEASWSRCMTHSSSAFGTVSALVNSAGIYRLAPLAETSLEEMNEHLRINAIGPFLGMQAFARAAEGGGAVVNIASTAALTGEAGSASYSASKWALRGLTRVAAAELAAQSIRVNCVLPGVVDSTMALANGPEVNAVTVAATPLLRMASPQDVATAVAFLLSQEASFLTAAELIVDGGFTNAPRIDLLRGADRGLEG